MTQAILNAVRAVPSIVQDPVDPTADELVPISDAELADNPEMDTRTHERSPEPRE